MRITAWKCCAILGLGLCTSGLASAPSYLMWQLPGSAISLPVYVYSGGSQVGFIPSVSLQEFVGVYDPASTSGSYQLYYQVADDWFSCSIGLKAGAVDSATTTCPGAVINPPVSQNGAQSNVYTLVMAATAWPAAAAAPSDPVATDYSQRTLTFTNNTPYPVIQIGESCNPGNATNSAPSCQNTPILASIAAGQSHVVTVGLSGLNSAAFYLSSYCTATTAADCATPPTIAQCSNTPSPPQHWVCTGGYFPGQSPYATKIEPTILAVSNSVPDGASNVDVSAVDGYSVGVKLYPASPTICTYTVPPENSNVLGAGSYSAQSPLAQVQPGSASALQTLCASSSQLPTGHSGGTPWNLVKTAASGDFEGCMSPCAYATANLGVNSTEAQQFCCSGAYDTPATCVVAAGAIGANTSSYNTNIQSSAAFQNVYGFAYGDAGSDYACPPETNLVVEFVSPSGADRDWAR